MNAENVRRLLPALALYPFIHRRRMSKAQFDVLIARAQEEAANPSFKAYFPLCVLHHAVLCDTSDYLCRYVCIGRKP